MTASIFLSILLSVVGFFLLAFYQQVQELVKQSKAMQITDAVFTERLKNIEKKIIEMEDEIKQLRKQQT